MAPSGASFPLPEGRVSTGNPGLDTMLEGGLVGRRPYLVVGPSGTGKTTLALQFLCEGVRHGERVLLVTVEEPPNEVRFNHRGLSESLDRVDVFDAIPDIMRYERVPFKDIASVRYAQAFGTVPLSIRVSPELSSVEVTLAALEQMLRTEVTRKGYTRIVIDSLTALQYFCMKGFDAVAGAQTFLRFLSDLRVTTILTVESPLEDIETPERALARGEIRLFRWEHENLTVRAIGVEKFRGSSHDVRLHPYRIGSRGLDINLERTISRDTRQIIEPVPPAFAVSVPSPVPIEDVVSPIDPLAEEVRDLLLVGADAGPVRLEIEAALEAIAEHDLDRCADHISRASSLAISICGSMPHRGEGDATSNEEVAAAADRLAQRAEAARAGLAPTRLPPPRVLEIELERVLALFYPGALEPVAETPGPSSVAVEAPAVEEPVPAPEPAAPEPVEPVAEPPPPVEPEPVVVAVPVEATTSQAVAPSEPTSTEEVPTGEAAPVEVEPTPEPPELPPAGTEARLPARAVPAPPPRVPSGPSTRGPPGETGSRVPSPSRPAAHGSEARPPLPSFTASAAPAPGSSRAAPRGPSPAPSRSAPPLPGSGAPAPAVTVVAAVSPSKRRRKPTAVPRKRPATAEVGGSAGETAVEVSDSSKPKKRAPRKRKTTATGPSSDAPTASGVPTDPSEESPRSAAVSKEDG